MIPRNLTWAATKATRTAGANRPTTTARPGLGPSRASAKRSRARGSSIPRPSLRPGRICAAWTGCWPRAAWANFPKSSMATRPMPNGAATRRPGPRPRLSGYGSSCVHGRSPGARQCLSRPDQNFFNHRPVRQLDGKQNARSDIFGLQHFLARFHGRRLWALVEQWRVDVAGEDGAGPNPIAALLDVDGLGEAREAEFGHDVRGAGFRIRQFARVGDNIHNGAGFSLAHQGQESLEAVVGAVQIGVDHAMIILQGEEFEAAPGSVRAGGVHEHFDRAEIRQDPPSDLLHAAAWRTPRNFPAARPTGSPRPTLPRRRGRPARAPRRGSSARTGADCGWRR